jgi:hypothetical protein
MYSFEVVWGATSNWEKQKGRELVAPCIEAPRSALHKDTPSRALVGRDLGRFCAGLGKFAVFDAARSRSYAKWLLVIGSGRYGRISFRGAENMPVGISWQVRRK